MIMQLLSGSHIEFSGSCLKREILSRSNMAVRSYGLEMDWRYMCTVTLTLEIKPWVHTLESLTTTASNIQIQHSGSDLLPWHKFWVCVQCYLDLGYMTLTQGHDTALDHRQQWYEISSRSNIAVRSYGPDTNFGFGYVCTINLTLEIWPCLRSWNKVMTQPLIIYNNWVKYSDRTRE